MKKEINDMDIFAAGLVVFGIVMMCVTGHPILAIPIVMMALFSIINNL